MKRYCLLTFLAFGLSLRSAKADLCYTENTTSVWVPIPVSIKVRIKGERSRFDTTEKYANFSVISRNGAAKITLVEPTLKIFAEADPIQSPLSQIEFPGGHANLIFSVKKLSPENVRGVETARSEVDILNGEPTKKDSLIEQIKIQTWNSNIPYPSVSGDAATFFQKLPIGIRHKFGDTFAFKGDVKGMKSALANLPTRIDLSIDGAGRYFSSTTITNVSTANLIPTLFAPPKGYRKVSTREWFEKRQMMLQDLTDKLKAPSKQKKT